MPGKNAVSYKTYGEVADAAHFSTPLRKQLFVLYMRARWPAPEDEARHCTFGYAEKWARRFKEGTALACSDADGQAILWAIAEFASVVSEHAMDLVIRALQESDMKLDLKEAAFTASFSPKKD